MPLGLDEWSAVNYCPLDDDDGLSEVDFCTLDVMS